MVNAKNVAAKVIVSLVAVGSLGIAGAGPLSGAVAEAAPQTAVTTPTSGPSTTTAGRARMSEPLQACRQHRRNLGYLTKAHSHAAARIARLKAQGAWAQKAGHVKLAQFWQRAATRRSSTLARWQAHLSKRTAAIARRNTKLGVTC